MPLSEHAKSNVTAGENSRLKESRRVGDDVGRVQADGLQHAKERSKRQHMHVAAHGVDPFPCQDSIAKDKLMRYLTCLPVLVGVMLHRDGRTVSELGPYLFCPRPVCFVHRPFVGAAHTCVCTSIALSTRNSNRTAHRRIAAMNRVVLGGSDKLVFTGEA